MMENCGHCTLIAYHIRGEPPQLNTKHQQKYHLISFHARLSYSSHFLIQTPPLKAIYLESLFSGLARVMNVPGVTRQGARPAAN